jgi:putative membrane protein
MAFGFVVARFGVFLREIVLSHSGTAQPRTPVSLYVGLGLILAGVAVCIGSAVRHGRYVRGIDEGHFRSAFGSMMAVGVVVLLTIVGIAMAIFLVAL